ncbi:MAG TPA: YitT family protein, partial [Anaerolineae bacterium]
PGMGFVERLRHAAWEAFETDLPRLTRLDTRKQLAYVISDEVEAVSKALLTELGRGVTLINAKGMFTGKEHGVLMCVVEANQIRQLKKLVSQVDPKAFVIVTSVQDVRGSGFRPLEA